MKESADRVKARAKLDTAEATFDRWWARLIRSTGKCVKAQKAAKRYRRALQDLDARERAAREAARAGRRNGSAMPEGEVTP